MGLRGEILDFVNSYAKTSDTATKQNAEQERARHDKAAEDIAQQNADTARSRLGASATDARARLGLATRHQDWLEKNGLGKNDPVGAVDDNPVVVPPAYLPSGGVAPVAAQAPAAGIPATDWSGGNAPVASYAGGGAVDDDEDDDEDSDEASSAAPTQQAVADEDEDNSGSSAGDQRLDATADILERWGARGEKGQDNPIAIGLKQMIKDAGLHQPSGAIPNEPGTPEHPGFTKMRSGDGALNDEELRALNNTVDPKGELSGSALSIARLDKAVNYYVDRGDMRKAATVAQALIARGQLDSQKYAAGAMDAIKKGDMNTAAGFLKRAYDQVPDGRDLEATVDGRGLVHATVTDADGNKQDLGAFGPAQVFKLARGVASGQDYYQRMAQIASGKVGSASDMKVANQQQAGGSPVPVKDMAMHEQGVNDAFDKMQQRNPNEPINEDTANTIKNVAVHLSTDKTNRSNGVTHDEAVTAAGQMIYGDPEKPNFKISPAGEKGVQVTFNDGREIYMPKQQFQRLAIIRAQRMKAAKDKAEMEQARQAKIAEIRARANQPPPGLTQDQASEAQARTVGATGL